MSKKIIVGGCSFSDKNYPKSAKPKPLDFKMWPTLIGEMHGLEVINTAKCGFGNQAIFHETLKAVWENIDNIEHVYVMWSEWARQDFLRNADDEKRWYETYVPRYEGDWATKTEAWYRRAFNHSYPNMEQLVKTNFNYIHTLQQTLKQLEIPYTACQGLPPMPWFKEGVNPDKEMAFEIIKHPLSETIENFIGWPILSNIGGYSMKELCELSLGQKYRVSIEDAHPNEIGHKFMASKIYEYSQKS